MSNPKPQPTKPQPPKSQSAPATKESPKVRLAQHIQVRLDDGTVRTLHAGEEYTVGKGPGEVDPAWLERQPLLDLDAERNQKAVAERRKLLGQITDQRETAESKGRQAARRVGRPQLRDYGII